LKPVLYLVAAIFLCAGVYAFIQYVPISYERVSYSVEQASIEADGPLKKSIDKESTVLCEIESFWSKYDFWGNTDVVFTSAVKDEAAEKKVDENVSCDESIENGVGQ